MCCRDSHQAYYITMTLYNSIGKDYNQTRQPDYRIIRQLISLLDLPQRSTIADVGAGTGNYSNAIADQGYQVIAIEPSQVMQSQGEYHPQVSCYLDPQVRNGISTFAKIPSDELEQGISRLATDIHHGIWLKKYEHLLQQENYDAGYRILVTK